MYAKTAIQKITKIETYLKVNKHDFSNYKLNEYKKILNHCRNMYEKYGGKIFAIGKVNGVPKYDPYTGAAKHWGGKITAEISNIHILKKPIDISKFRDFIYITRGAEGTNVFGTTYERLKNLILKENKCPNYFVSSDAIPIPLKKISVNNWIELSNRYRRQFFLEGQFREFYTNYLLRYISDNKRIYAECTCKKKNLSDKFVDNVIKINNKYLCVEIKLNKDSEKDVCKQLEQYCCCEKIYKDNKIFDNRFNNISILIDIYAIFIYEHNTKKLNKIIDLDNIHNKDDLLALKERITKLLKKYY